MRFDSGYLAKDIINGLKEEIDVVSYITDETYVRLYNELIELLYGEIIRDSKIFEIQVYDTFLSDSQLDINKEHIKDVYYNDIQLSKGKAEQVGKIDNIYYTDNDDRFFFSANPLSGSGILRIYYNYIPERLVNLNDEKTVPLPFAFLEIVTSKLRGEIYKLLNEDELSAKWLNDYNNLLENFKAYMLSRETRF